METIYKKNFLIRVICRLDFPPILILKNQEPINFQNEIRKEFPIYEKEIQNILSLKSDGQEPPKVEQSIINWVFKSQDKVKKIILNSNVIILEYTKYSHFPLFKEDLSLILNIFEKQYAPSFYTKLGLRYVNEIMLNNGNLFEWEGFIHKELTAPVKGFVSNKLEIIRSMHNLQLFKDPHKINFNYGLFNSDYPNKIAKKEFMLDYDCRLEEDTSCEKALSLITKFNVDIYDLFEQSIYEKLRSILKGD